MDLNTGQIWGGGVEIPAAADGGEAAERSD
jgi:hypothetical protein